MPDIAIAVENLGKLYRIGQAQERSDSLVGAVASTLTAPLRNWRRLARLNTFGHDDSNGAAPDDAFWALEDVSFEVERGDVLGVIGRNGAGKSTLLKVLSRITEPTRGRVRTRGRMASLLEVGTGFHPELTGRENIYMNGTILGMTRREISRKFDEIVEFSGVERFLDTPVKRYSSGMSVRLGFAVAAHLEPDILVVDEVLAVGDSVFQRKCLGKMREVTAGGGRTVLFVSHSAAMIRATCTKGILMRSGRLERHGDIEDIISAYERSYLDQASDHFRADVVDPSRPLQILEASVVDGGGDPTNSVRLFDEVGVRIRYEVREPLAGANLAAILHYKGADLLISFDTDASPERLESRSPGVYDVLIRLPSDRMKPGSYSVSLASGFLNSGRLIERLDHCLSFEVREVGNMSLLSYSHARAGLICSSHPWETLHEGEPRGMEASPAGLPVGAADPSNS